MTDEATEPTVQQVTTKPGASDDQPVQLVSTAERLAYQVGASVFYYRRMPAETRNRLLKKCTARGETNYGKFQTLALQWSLKDWKNVVDIDGHQVPFDTALVGIIPGDTALELQDLMGANIAEDDERLGNS